LGVDEDTANLNPIIVGGAQPGSTGLSRIATSDEMLAPYVRNALSDERPTVPARLPVMWS